MSVAVTAHAKKRLKERCGINKNSAARMAERAFTEGISFDNAGELLQKYISSVYLKHDKMCNNLRIYGNTVYVFDNRTLITVYSIPQNILSEVNAIATSIDEAADKTFSNYKKEKPPIGKNLTARKDMLFNMQMVRLDEIKIPKHIENTPPRKDTIQRHRSYYISTGQIKEPITLGSDNYLLNGYCDYLIAREYQYDSIACIVQNTPGSIRNRSNARKELYEHQNGKCAFCGSPIPFELTSMICSSGANYCICPKCNTLHSIAKNPGNPKSPRKKGIDFNGIKENIVSYFEQLNAIIKKVSLYNGVNGQYIEVKFDYVNNKITPDCFKELSDRYNIRICSSQIL